MSNYTLPVNVNGRGAISILWIPFYDTINGEATIDLCKAIEERYPKAGIITSFAIMHVTTDQRPSDNSLKHRGSN